MKKMFSLVALFACFAALSGCAATSLMKGAERIQIVNEAPAGSIYLGEVTGSQGGSFGGGWTSNENLETGARNDMKNKALALGGDYVVIVTNRAGNTSGQQTNVTITASVYKKK